MRTSLPLHCSTLCVTLRPDGEHCWAKGGATPGVAQIFKSWWSWPKMRLRRIIFAFVCGENLWKFVSSFWFLIRYCQLMYLLIHVDSRGFWSRHWCKASKMVKHRCRWNSEQKWDKNETYESMSSQTLYTITIQWHHMTSWKVGTTVINGTTVIKGYQRLQVMTSLSSVQFLSVPISSSALHFDWSSWSMSWRAWHLCGQSLENVWGQKKRLISVSSCLIMSHHVSSCLIMSHHVSYVISQF